MAVLTREQILGADDLPRELVHCPIWGGDVWVWALDGTQRSQYQAELIEQQGEDARVNLVNADVRLAALSMRDENGAPLFTLDDVGELGRKSAVELNRIVEVARRLSALSADDVKELTAGLKDTPSDAGTST